MKELNFVEILTRLFMVGLVCNTFSLIIQLILSFLEEPPVTPREESTINIFYHINIALVTIFLTQAFFFWKKMVLYQKNERLLQTWYVFEYLLLISLLFNFFEFDLTHLPFSIALGVLLVMGLFLSVNLKWVAYLNAKEKWQSILLLLFISIFSYYFFYTVIRHSDIVYFTTDLMHSVYVLAIFVFVIFYSIFSLLVIIFNLPTTPVFQEINDVIVSLQRLVETLQMGEKEDQVYEVLLEKAYNSLAADAAWLEIVDEKGRQQANIVQGDIDLETVNHIRRILKNDRLRKILKNTFSAKSSQNGISDRVLEEIAYYDFESILTTPLVANERSLGSLTLLKKVRDGFDDEKKELVHTFARQASISIEYFRMLSRTIEAERYKEEFKIAQRIQQSLLPSKLDLDEHLEISAFSESAYEVGGDYYDAYQAEDGKIMMIVGDVSGKGTTAAFHMSQMKGIFQSLAQLNLNTREFLEQANHALSRCMSKASFMTVTIMLIDPCSKKVEFARAGHCPTLYYNEESKQAHYFQGKGLGLGILRSEKYHQHIDNQEVACKEGDIILLYTDGIVEAKNRQKEEYGYTRLQNLLELHAHLSSEEIIQKIRQDLKSFGENIPPHDDYTAVLVKFRNYDS